MFLQFLLLAFSVTLCWCSIKNRKDKWKKAHHTHCAHLLSVPGLVSSYVALDDDGLLSEELEVPPAEEASDVPLDGDGSPGLGAAPLLLQQLIQQLLEEHLPKTTDVNI